jgi:LmbE family N-acetylglucosaminyl deacetylase
MNYVAITAHPDDAEALCGGTLLRLSSQERHQLTILVTSDGSKGAADGKPGKDIAAIRDSEGRAAAKLLGADYHNLGFVDGELVDTVEMRAAMVTELRRTRAEVVITLAPDDYSSDHIAVSRAATAACQHAGAAGFAEGGERLPSIPALYYMEPVCGGGTEPTLYVDVTDVFERKLEALACHRSQFELMSASYDVDLLEMAKIAGAWRGLQSRVRYAEGFTACSSWPRRRAGAHLPS